MQCALRRNRGGDDNIDQNHGVWLKKSGALHRRYDDDSRLREAHKHPRWEKHPARRHQFALRDGEFRMSLRSALRTGLPVHILAKVMGHLNLNTAQGYATVFDEDVARHFREFVDRRRSLRPVEDYREPTHH